MQRVDMQSQHFSILQEFLTARSRILWFSYRISPWPKFVANAKWNYCSKQRMHRLSVVVDGDATSGGGQRGKGARATRVYAIRRESSNLARHSLTWRRSRACFAPPTRQVETSDAMTPWRRVASAMYRFRRARYVRLRARHSAATLPVDDVVTTSHATCTSCWPYPEHRHPYEFQPLPQPLPDVSYRSTRVNCHCLLVCLHRL